jgi:hypothetical protein
MVDGIDVYSPEYLITIPPRIVGGGGYDPDFFSLYKIKYPASKLSFFSFDFLDHDGKD